MNYLDRKTLVSELQEAFITRKLLLELKGPKIFYCSLKMAFGINKASIMSLFADLPYDQSNHIINNWQFIIHNFFK
jgi:uncharacterized membrane protein YGL010W